MPVDSTTEYYNRFCHKYKAYMFFGTNHNGIIIMCTYTHNYSHQEDKLASSLPHFFIIITRSQFLDFRQKDTISCELLWGIASLPLSMIQWDRIMEVNTNARILDAIVSHGYVSYIVYYFIGT